MYLLLCNNQCVFKVGSFFYFRGDANVDDHEHVSHQPSLVQQLTLELSRKKMIFSKNGIHLSKVVGQGLYNYT